MNPHIPVHHRGIWATGNNTQPMESTTNVMTWLQHYQQCHGLVRLGPQQQWLRQNPCALQQQPHHLYQHFQQVHNEHLPHPLQKHTMDKMHHQYSHLWIQWGCHPHCPGQPTKIIILSMGLRLSLSCYQPQATQQAGHPKAIMERARQDSSHAHAGLLSWDYGMDSYQDTEQKLSINLDHVAPFCHGCMTTDIGMAGKTGWFFAMGRSPARLLFSMTSTSLLCHVEHLLTFWYDLHTVLCIGPLPQTPPIHSTTKSNSTTSAR